MQVSNEISHLVVLKTSFGDLEMISLSPTWHDAEVLLLFVIVDAAKI